MKRKVILKKNWNAGIDVIYDEGKDIKLITTEEDFRKNLIDNIIRNFDSSKIIDSIDIKKLSWSFSAKTIKNIIGTTHYSSNEAVLQAVIDGLKDTLSDIKKDTWKKLV